MVDKAMIEFELKKLLALDFNCSEPYYIEKLKSVRIVLLLDKYLPVEWNHERNNDPIFCKR